MEINYGFCPMCGAPGFSRERRPNGDDVCERGHKYPSLNAVREPSYLGQWVHKITNTIIEVIADYRGHLLTGVISRPFDEPKLLDKENFTDHYKRV